MTLIPDKNNLNTIEKFQKSFRAGSADMRNKAIEVYKKTCSFNAPDCCGCKDERGECDCEQFKDYITELDNLTI